MKKTKLTYDHIELLTRIVIYRLSYVRRLKNEIRPREEKLLSEILEILKNLQTSKLADKP